ncbi:putative WD-repeat protein [Phaeosphaeriaceae sp. PMI808]|nr:putative WD-repeat protein [Phaeosphaeriaceae sp. PMI808]
MPTAPIVQTLPTAADAPFNTYQRQHDSTCLPDTRVELLQDIYNWADGQGERCIFWLNGLAGTGKSTIARTIARTYLDQKRLGASFFFSHGGGDVGHAGKFVTSIAWQLASNIPSLDQHIGDALTESRDITSQSLRDQWQQLVLRPLSKLSEITYQSSYVLVVDALDECDNNNNIGIIIHLLTEARSLKTVRLRVLLTSRPEIPIRYGFSQISDSQHRDFVLHSISQAIVDHDISVFFEHHFKLIRQEYSLHIGWPGENITERLIQKAGGLFIWAATACRFIQDGPSADKRVQILLEGGTTIGAPEEHLDELYITILKKAIRPGYSVQERQGLYDIHRHVLGSIVVLLSPLAAGPLGRLLEVPKQEIEQVLKHHHAIFDIPKADSCPLRLQHPSFRDFLLDDERCRDPNFFIDEKQAHQVIVSSCIRLMSTSLKQDICGVNAPGVLVADIERSLVERSLPPEVQYACLHWVEHVQRSGIQPLDNEQICQFLQQHLLHWLEALGWMRKVAEGVHAITSLESLAAASVPLERKDLHQDLHRKLHRFQKQISGFFSTPLVPVHPRQVVHTAQPNLTNISNFIHDAKRFILYSRSGIEQAPLQIYCSALAFAPERSVVKRQFRDRAFRWIRILPRMDQNWDALLQTLEGHVGSVTAVAFSLDGKMLASASRDSTFKLWDARSGSLLQTLEGHGGWVTAMAFSPDGKTLASASCDTIKLWDASSGKLLQTLEGHKKGVNAVAFSPDGKTLALASGDSTIKLWDARSRKLLQTLEGHKEGVNVVAFSPDGKTLASASEDSTVKLWDAGLGKLLQTLEGYKEGVNAVAFSPDAKMLASALGDSTIKLWDARSGSLLQTLEGHRWWVNAVAFSPDGKMLASASEDRTVKLWDAGLGKLLQTLEGHGGWVTAIASSPDSKTLESALDDSTVKLWDAGSRKLLQTLEGHKRGVNAVAFSPDGKTLASASEDSTVKLWDAGLGKLLQTLEGHKRGVNAIAFSPDAKMLASASGDSTIKLWDARSGSLLQTLEGHRWWVNAVAFSPDGKMLASASEDRTVKLWDAGSGAVLQTFGVGTDIKTLSFCDDGTSLQTNRGRLPILSSPLHNSIAVNSLQLQPFILVQGQWVCRGTERILWLPPEHRPHCIAAYRGIVAFGYTSGRVTMLEFAV